MTIEAINKIEPRRIPETPQEIVHYLLSDEKAREEFNKSHPGIWNKYNTGFFSTLRSVLGHNQGWIDLLTELAKPDQSLNVGAITAKIRAFQNECFVGDLIGQIPYFQKWATAQSYKDQNPEWKE
jgi:hypothetical protein